MKPITEIIIIIIKGKRSYLDWLKESYLLHQEPGNGCD
jgi:hypothetical protein